MHGHKYLVDEIFMILCHKEFPVKIVAQTVFFSSSALREFLTTAHSFKKEFWRLNHFPLVNKVSLKPSTCLNDGRKVVLMDVYSLTKPFVQNSARCMSDCQPNGLFLVEPSSSSFGVLKTLLFTQVSTISNSNCHHHHDQAPARHGNGTFSSNTTKTEEEWTGTPF